MLALGLVLIGLLLVLGAPVWLGFAVGGVFLNVLYQGLDPTVTGVFFWSAIDSWVFLAVPFFLIAGNLMAYCGSSEAMFSFIDDLIGHLPGGMAVAAVGACTVFAALTGSSVATVIAIGTIAVPPMLKIGYEKKFTLGLIASSGTLGEMIPPSIYAIVYGSLTSQDVGRLFLAQIVPGLIIALGLMIVAIYISVKRRFVTKPPASWNQRGRSFAKGVPALLMPIIILGGIYGGIFTPTEAAAVASVYALLISFAVYKGLTWSTLRRSMVEAAETTCVLYIIVGAAGILSKVLTAALIPQAITTAIVGAGLSVNVFLLMVGILWFILGCFLDPVPIMLITLPTLYPAVVAMGVNPIHFCVVTVSWMLVAQVTPPFGVSLFALAGRFHEKMQDIVAGSLPFLAVLIASTLVITYVPKLSLIFER